MTSFDLLRQRMVKNQLMPEGVLDESILKAFGETPREYFVPKEKEEIAYLDEAIHAAEERFLMRPALLARLFEAAHFKKTDRVLYLGALTGYGPVILSSLVHEVVAVESDPFLFAEIQQNQARLKIANITPLKGDLKADYTTPGLYDVIFIEGAIQKIPETLCKQLHPQGFVLAILQDEEQGGHAVRLLKNEKPHHFQTLFYATTPLLKAFKTETEFSF